MKDYKDLKSILEGELSEAIVLHEFERFDRQRTSEKLAGAIERLDRLAARGIVAEHLTEAPLTIWTLPGSRKSAGLYGRPFSTRSAPH
jgi:hypothetical protein